MLYSTHRLPLTALSLKQANQGYVIAKLAFEGLQSEQHFPNAGFGGGLMTGLVQIVALVML